MKSFLVMIVILVAGDALLFSCAYTVEGWHIARSGVRYIAVYADERTQFLPRA